MTKNHRFTMYQNIIRDEGQIINPFECMKLLNYFWDENNDLVQMNEQLREENEKLKKRLEDVEQEYNLLRRTAYKIDEIVHVDREYAERLYRQNQQLEEELQYRKSKCGSLEEGLLKLRHRHSNLHDLCCDLECEKDSLKKDVESLEEENEQLQYDRNNCRKQQIRQANKIHELFDENEQLKQKVDFYKDFQKDARELDKENERLKKEINMLKTTIGRNEVYIQRIRHKGEWR